MSDGARILELLQSGYDQQQRGALDGAKQCYLKVLKIETSNSHALNLLGVLETNHGDPARAISYISKALTHDPNNPQSHANIALAYKDLAKYNNSIHHFQASIRLAPDNPATHNNLGNVLRDVGQSRQAVRCFENALQRDPSYAECWSNLAAAQSDLDNYEHGLFSADRALKLNSNLAQAHYSKGDILRKFGQLKESLKCFDRAITLDEMYTEAMVSKSDVQRDLDLPEQAINTLRQVLEISPQNPYAHHALGVIQEQLGDRQSAAKYFRQTIELAPTYTSAYYQLAQLKGQELSDCEVINMEKLWKQKDIVPNDRKMLAFALFRAFDGRDNTDKAFRFLAAGNEIKATQRSYDDSATAALMEGIFRTAEQLKKKVDPHRQGQDDCRPVFILGMPRSGTTLTEQVLGMHTDTFAAGEVSYAYECARLASKMTGKEFPACVGELNTEKLQAIATHYMSRFTKKALSKRYVLDKTPLNFQYLGLLALALPKAKFLHCRRNPVDNCFSIHRIPFDEKQTYAHSLEGLGKYYRHYDRLMSNWSSLFGDRILDLVYEDTVNDLEQQSRAMLSFLDLPYQVEVLNYHQTEGLVKTPSASQVREPIYKDSVMAWRRYEKWLGPLLLSLNYQLAECSDDHRNEARTDNCG